MKDFLRDFKFYRGIISLQVALLSLGLIAFIFTSIVRNGLENKLKAEQGNLLTSDLSINSRMPFTDEFKAQVYELIPTEMAQTYPVYDIYTMAVGPSDQSRLVEIRATTQDYPFYGALLNESGQKVTILDELIVSKELARLWTLKIGDEIKIGNQTLRVGEILSQDTSVGWRGFALAPRLYLPYHLLTQTEILQPGSTGGFALHFRFKPAWGASKVEEVEKLLKKNFPDPSIKFQTSKNFQGQLQRVTNLLSDFIQLMTILGFCLATLGFFYLERSLLVLQQKDYSIFRVLGLSSSAIKLILGRKLFVKYVIACLVGLGFSYLIFVISKNWIQTTWGLPELPFVLDLSLVFYLLSLGAMLYLLLSGDYGQLVKTSLTELLSDQVLHQKYGLNLFRGLMLLILLGLIFFQVTHSWKLSLYSLFGMVFAVYFFYLMAILVKRLLKPFARRFFYDSSIKAGLALLSIVRRPQIFILSLLSLSLSWMILVFTLSLEKTFLNDLSADGDRAQLFLFDIQPEQMDPLKQFAKNEGIHLTNWSPMVRAKLTHINQKEYSRDESKTWTQEDEEAQRFRARMMNLSFSSQLNPSERLVEGQRFDLKNAQPQISVEKRFAQRVGIKLNDRLTFDISGVHITGEVVNFRSVRWTSFRPNFFIVFSPGVLEEAPQTWLATIERIDFKRKMELITKMAKLFPTVSVLDMDELLTTLVRLFNLAANMISVISWFSLAVGVGVLLSLAYEQMLKRKRDFMLMKILGLSRDQISQTLLLEIGLILVLSVVLGTSMGLILSWVLCVNYFEMSFVSDWITLLGLGAGGTLMMLSLFVVTLRQFLNLKPSGLFQGT